MAIVSDPKGPLRVLKVALDPPELGRVTIRLRLTGRTLEVKVSAERPETARMLEHDRPLLARILAASGYVAEDISVQAAAPSASASMAQPRQEPQGGSQATQTYLPNASAEGEKQQPRQSHGEEERRLSAQETPNDAADSDTPRGGDLYV